MSFIDRLFYVLYSEAYKHNKEKASRDIAEFGVSFYVIIICAAILFFVDSVLIDLLVSDRVTTVLLVGIPVVCYVGSVIYFNTRARWSRIISQIEKEHLDKTKIQQQVMWFSIVLFGLIGIIAVLMVATNKDASLNRVMMSIVFLQVDKLLIIKL